jgi:hypothetical protein
MAIGNVAQGGAQQRNITFQFSLYQRNVYQIVMRPSLSPASKTSLDLWSQAYELAIQREEELMRNYKKCLNSFINGRPPINADLLDPNYVIFITKRLLESLEQKNGKNPPTASARFADMQPHVDKLTKLLRWSEPVVKPIMSTQPHKALAWSSIPLFLSVGCHITGSPIASDDERRAHVDQLLQHRYPCDETILQGFSSLADMQMFWIAFEKLYTDLSRIPQHKELKSPLSNLYSFIIEYQVRAACHLSKSRLPWAAKLSKKSNKWIRMMKSIRTLNEGCRSLLSSQQKARIRRNRDAWKKKAQQLRRYKEVTLSQQEYM